MSNDKKATKERPTTVTEVLTEKDVGTVEVLANGSMAMVPAGPTAITKPGDIDTDTGIMTDEAFQEMLKGEGWSLETVVSLKKDQAIAGVFLGPGPSIPMAPDRETGEIKELRSWLVQPNPRVTVTLIGSHKINTRLSVLPPGWWVGIKHLGKVERPGTPRQLNDYLIVTKDPTRKTLPGG